MIGAQRLMPPRHPALVEGTIVDVESAPSVVPRVASDRDSPRTGFVDVFRGLLIAHMALDHASMFFNRGRGEEELAVRMPEPVYDLVQFLTRFTGVPVAPGFCFMAGFMVATTSAARESRGVPKSDVTQKLLTRGLVLILADAIVLGLPRAAMGFYSFMVLSAVGVSIMALALVRDVPTRILLPVAMAMLCLHPLLDVSGLPTALRAVLYEPVRAGAFRSMYPVVPWGAIVLAGFVTGRDAATREQPVKFWLSIAGVCLVAFFGIRLAGGYGNAYPHAGPFTVEFWMFSKYPPDLPFLAWSFAVVFASLAGLKALTARCVPPLLRPFVVFGRVPFFFYLVHFYVLMLAMAALHTKTNLAGTYAIWGALLLAMAWPRAWYFKKKQERPNWITRYL